LTEKLFIDIKASVDIHKVKCTPQAQLPITESTDSVDSNSAVFFGGFLNGGADKRNLCVVTRSLECL
jgi:hypothetical protein